jgi:hypothetical protein
MPFDGVRFVTHEPLDKLDQVIDLLGTPDRWCKGALRSHDGRYCIRGAVRAVNGAELLEPAILQAVVEVAGRRFRRIEAFNDHPNTSHDQIVAVLHRARDNIIAGKPVGTKARLRETTASWLCAMQGAVLGCLSRSGVASAK